MTSIDLAALVDARFEQSITVPETFFEAASEQIAQACWAMARRFHQGGRLDVVWRRRSGVPADFCRVHRRRGVVAAPQEESLMGSLNKLMKFWKFGKDDDFDNQRDKLRDTQISRRPGKKRRI